MELLHQSAKVWKDYPEYLLHEEHFLSKLTGNTDEEYTVEEYLLEKAEGFGSSVNEEFKKIETAKSALEDILYVYYLGKECCKRIGQKKTYSIPEQNDRSFWSQFYP